MTKYTNLWINGVAEHHAYWINTVKNFGGGDDSEDIVQELYINLIKLYKKDDTLVSRIFVGGKLKKSYISRALHNITRSVQNKKNKNRSVPIECLIKSLETDNHRATTIKKMKVTNEDYVFCEQRDEEQEAKDRFLSKVKKEVDSWDDKDSETFNEYKDKGISLRKLAEKTDGSHFVQYSIIKKAKEKLKESLSEDWEDLNNGDYELI